MAHHHTPAALLSHLAPARRRSEILLRGHYMVCSLIFIYWSIYTPQTYFKFKALTYARIDSVTEPIWLTLSSRQLQAFSSTALLMRLGLVTVRSSPTIWMSVLPVKLVQAAQSSWSKGSSMETTAKICRHSSLDSETDDHCDLNWNICHHVQLFFHQKIRQLLN